MQNQAHLSQNPLKIIQTTNIVDFVPLLKELEFGDQFSLAMLKWCGIGERDKTLTFWQVYIVKLEGESIGVMGLYQTTNSPSNVVWVGWFGLRPQFRREGWGSIMMKSLKGYAQEFGFQELWVFTNYNNLPALSFYEKSAFMKLGTAAEVCPGQTHNLSDVILKTNLQS